MENGKHRGWVVFYIFAIVFILFIVLYLNGALPLWLSDLNLIKPSANITEIKLKALCDVERYQNVATLSLKIKEGRYAKITDDDILKSDSESGKSGMTMAVELCKTLSSVRKVDKKQVSENEWDFVYHTGILYDVGKIYKIVNIDGDWRFVLD